MENTNALTHEPLFHTQVLKNDLKQDAIPAQHQSILRSWSQELNALNQQDSASWHTAFLQNILASLLGYRPFSGDNPGFLQEMDGEKAYFDAALGLFEKGNERIAALVKVMGPSTFNLDTLSETEQLSLIALARRQAKGMPDKQFFLLTNLDEIRLYSLVHKRNTFESFSLMKMTENPAEYQRFHLLLCAENLLSGKTLQRLHESVLAGLQDKLTKNHANLKETYGALLPGAAVELEDPFVINQQTRDKLVAEDSKSAEILKSFYAGDRLRKWHADSRLHWLIYTPKGKVDIDAYPAVKKYLQPFKEQLEKRGGDQKWYELDHEEQASAPSTTNLLLGTGSQQPAPGFVLGEAGAQYGKGSYYITNADYFLFGLLNSAPLVNLMTTVSRPMDNGMYEILAHQIESLPVPDAEGQLRARIGLLSKFCMEVAQDRRDMIRHFQGMTAFNLSPQKEAAQLSERLLNWFALDFEAFRKEIIASFGVDIPANDLQLWTDYFNQQRISIDNVNSDLEYAEEELDQLIYDLFGLDEDEIGLIERR